MNEISLPIAIYLGIAVFVLILGMLIMKHYFDKFKL
jgi:hypothetical protein